MKRKTAKGPSPAAGVSAEPDPAAPPPGPLGARLRRAGRYRPDHSWAWPRSASSSP
ncbi:MAG: hypothetical protein MZV64_52630 [Ignavibacteriales bacterium]|nr:hypothetical protein [Ignavibacteriales bacterium]